MVKSAIQVYSVSFEEQLTMATEAGIVLKNSPSKV